MKGVFLKQHGCTSIMGDITCRIRQGRHILFVMQLGITRTGHLLIKVGFKPVIGWTTHHSICKIENKSFLFDRDSSLSNGVTQLRSVKVSEIIHDEEGLIGKLKPYGD